MSLGDLINDPAKLTRHIETRYHDRHRIQLPGLIELAERVELVHFGDEHAPDALAAHLRQMQAAFEVHMKKEELILFPAIRRAAHALDAPISAMREDHDGHVEDIARIRQLTHGLTVPAGACRSWTKLYDDLSTFISDLEEHIRLENEVLFPLFETQAVRNA